ncbi:hypothetical protein RIF29_06878 [Crotalaria pallida]|uniref:Uncharacterized protein n=1 Tax=Crotalaria pallida TaxID=3830 RepID=A0AAN9PBS1_CROPI
MESALVIKVKYGDTLRRFSARVNENKQLDLDMVGLKAKIGSLFNFSADANFILRYSDEDGDMVTLVDDDDIHDMMRQRLRFLRIFVHMTNDSAGKSNANSSGNATPSRSPQVPDPYTFLTGRNAVADVLKSVHEPLHEVLSNISLVSKAASPVLANLADTITKVGKPILNSHSKPNVAAGPSSTNAATGENASPEVKGSYTYVHPTLPSLNDVLSKMGNSPFGSPYQPHVSYGPSTKNGVPGECVTSEATFPQYTFCESATSGSPFHAFGRDFIFNMGKPVYQWPHVAGAGSGTGVSGEHVIHEAKGSQSTYVDSTSNGSQPADAGNVGGGVKGRVAPVDLNIPPIEPIPKTSQSSNVNIAQPNGKKGKTPANDGFAGKGKISGTSSSSDAPNDDSNWTHSTAYIKTPIYTRGSKISGASSSSAAPNNGSTRSTSSAFNTCPFYGPHPFKRSHSHAMTMSGMFHKGVRCDGCGAYPITGPRFKSKVKENYDLCSICFNTMGNATDYNRIDRFPHGCFPTLPHTLKVVRPKLDSRFILDVNVIDGTMMAPSTAFTKIWRIRNSGSLVWPMGTQLVWIGGDKFSDSHSVDLEIPVEGVPVEKELDIAVEFRAPQSPGRYISYWRMASPSGQKFGQRVWVLIQVDASLKDSFYDSSQGLNLNIPLDVSGSTLPQIIDINVQPTDEDSFLNAPTVIENQQAVHNHLMQVLEKEFPINEATFVSASASPPASSAASAATAAMASSASATAATAPSAPAPTVAPSSVSYPIVDLTESTPAGSNNPFSAVDAPASSSSLGAGGNEAVEETLLKELEAMGFKQVDLNKEILRINEYNLEQAVEDLCGVSDWDPILEELYEMGFRDNDMNKKLLLKNNGSIKRVVMDLINGEQP